MFEARSTDTLLCRRIIANNNHLVVLRKFIEMVANNTNRQRTNQPGNVHLHTRSIDSERQKQFEE